ncbi:MAG: tetraacyldisaccharide 4'-kinase [Acidobacteriaceae bacterium]
MTPARENLFPYAVSPLTWPLALTYAMGTNLKNAAYDYGWLKPRSLSSPVISVGNLSVGGTGKTPLVLLLADKLTQRGWTIDVLSRGYGRDSQEIARVDPLGMPEKFGDEPLLLARHGLSVYVGPDRYRPGKLAERNVSVCSSSSRHLHILDDGFQHRKLARSADIVVVHRADMSSHLLPAGRLREPLRALRRADICVLRAEDAELTDRILDLMSHPDRKPDPARVWIVQRRTTLPEPADSIKKTLAFCALGDPNGFFDGARRAGVDVRETVAFRDHHAYTLKDVQALRAAARHCGAQSFLTTEKDSVRLTGTLRNELEKEGHLIVAGLEISLQHAARCIDSLEALLGERLQLRPRDVR